MNSGQRNPTGLLHIWICEVPRTTETAQLDLRHASRENAVTRNSYSQASLKLNNNYGPTPTSRITLAHFDRCLGGVDHGGMSAGCANATRNRRASHADQKA